MVHQKPPDGVAHIWIGSWRRPIIASQFSPRAIVRVYWGCCRYIYRTLQNMLFSRKQLPRMHHDAAYRVYRPHTAFHRPQTAYHRPHTAYHRLHIAYDSRYKLCCTELRCAAMRSVVLCYDMICCVMLCCVMLCYAMLLWYATLRYAML